MSITSKNFKEIRTKLGFTLKYVAVHSKVAKTTIHRLEAGGEVGYKKLQRLQHFYEQELAAHIEGAAQAGTFDIEDAAKAGAFDVDGAAEAEAFGVDDAAEAGAFDIEDASQAGAFDIEDAAKAGAAGHAKVGDING